MRKLIHKNHNLDLVKVSAFAKFDQIPSICSQDTECKTKFAKRNTKGRNCCKFANTCNSPKLYLIKVNTNGNLIKFHSSFTRY